MKETVSAQDSVSIPRSCGYNEPRFIQRYQRVAFRSRARREGQREEPRGMEVCTRGYHSCVPRQPVYRLLL